VPSTLSTVGEPSTQETSAIWLQEGGSSEEGRPFAALRVTATAGVILSEAKNPRASGLRCLTVRTWVSKGKGHRHHEAHHEVMVGAHTPALEAHPWPGAAGASSTTQRVGSYGQSSAMTNHTMAFASGMMTGYFWPALGRGSELGGGRCRV